ncbi:hypothetical protein ZOSMA_121G00740 [Zostera marina]|uniref:FAR1 domain-containing protein n=1 Tax=Zostera marina TaxID=29655 RepID=A0A0K9Q0S6_ZOSMR|nr:hypothetical protein ZOSMA_121G00740 [Zostera marina]
MLLINHHIYHNLTLSPKTPFISLLILSQYISYHPHIYRPLHAQPLNTPTKHPRPQCNVSLDFYSIQSEKSSGCNPNDTYGNAEYSRNNDFPLISNATYGPHECNDISLDNGQTPISSKTNDVTRLRNANNSSDDASPSFFIHKQPTDTNASSGSVKVNSPPFVGQIFSSYSDALDQYYGYASIGGFSVRLGSTNYNTSKVDGKKLLVMRRLLCFKKGKVDLLQPVKLSKRHKNAVLRCGCYASVKIKREAMSEEWIVKNIVLEHNHPLTTPSKVRFLSINRSILSTSRLLFNSPSEVNVPVSQQTAYFSSQVGGIEHMRCIQLDISNLGRDDRVDFKNYDVNLLVEEFELKKSVQPDFFSIVEDSTGRLKHVFWDDSIMIQHFKLLGDAVTFDTTYKTNVYSLIFEIFCGVNHHRNTVIFGSAFLR